jgi:alpha-galactosidase
VNQDALGKQASTVFKEGDARVLARDLEDGSKAVGLFNTGSNGVVTVTVKWSDLKISGRQSVRDLWRQKDLGRFADKFELAIPPHGAELVKISAK